MDEDKKKEDEFVRKYEAAQNEKAEDFVRRYSATERELAANIEFLIVHRQLMRDVELERLEEESKKLLRKLKSLEVEEMVEEIQCFKEILSLQKTLLQNNDKPRD